MDVAVISAEAVPCSKTGGLGDVDGTSKGAKVDRRRQLADHALLLADPKANSSGLNRMEGRAAYGRPFLLCLWLCLNRFLYLICYRIRQRVPQRVRVDHPLSVDIDTEFEKPAFDQLHLYIRRFS